MNRSTSGKIKYMNGSGFFFSKARYMNGVGFEILARTPVSQLHPPPRPRENVLSDMCAQRRFISVIRGCAAQSESLLCAHFRRCTDVMAHMFFVFFFSNVMLILEVVISATHDINLLSIIRKYDFSIKLNYS